MRARRRARSKSVPVAAQFCAEESTGGARESSPASVLKLRQAPSPVSILRRVFLPVMRSAMRLWSLHPKYLDVKGLVRAWREGLLARKALGGETKGYRNHSAPRRPAFF